jgi:hypothetical protein
MDFTDYGASVLLLIYYMGALAVVGGGILLVINASGIWSISDD